VPRRAKSLTESGSAYRKLSIPRVTKVALRGFSVYALNKSVEVEVSPGTTCLACANGLGKSTFLSASKYGLTGAIVTAEGPQSRDLGEYRKAAISFAREYYTGRITERDRDRASVSLPLRLGEYELSLERPIFSAKPELSRFSVVLPASRQVVVPDTRNTSAETKLDAYQSFITTQVGLQNYDQFLFQHHYVLMFDENRHLLFWDNRPGGRAVPCSRAAS
jgi:DNA repair exonuclease SbcCD ATPase subunit